MSDSISTLAELKAASQTPTAARSVLFDASIGKNVGRKITEYQIPFANGE